MERIEEIQALSDKILGSWAISDTKQLGLQACTIATELAINLDRLTAELAGYREAAADNRLIKLPRKMGDTVYVLTRCDNIIMSRDDDWLTGTGAVECPFENKCNFADCDDNNYGIIETIFSGYLIEESCMTLFFDKLANVFLITDFGKTIFLTRPEAEAALTKGGE